MPTCLNTALVVVTSSPRSEEHTSEFQSRSDLVCRLLLEKKTSVAEMSRVSAKFDSSPQLSSVTPDNDNGDVATSCLSNVARTTAHTAAQRAATEATRPYT